ncbi:ph domain-containing protein [Stemphylium lycopersici]|uniref:Ph domain-containing protein n=1 Tax=Stemphylium lycopersici TaxID=183478 RepID=A0A364MYF7_STELY|nr:ph domain-containing protein [Stemphylium lycopersici]
MSSLLSLPTVSHFFWGEKQSLMLRPARPFTVLSFMSQWGGVPNTLQKSPSSAGPSPGPASPAPPSPSTKQPATNYAQSATALETFNNERPPSRAATQRERSDSRASVRPMSMIQTYQPPVMEVSQDTLPELQRIFMFLNSHSNKLYQEGYFLKFHDTDYRGRPAPDRRWQEYFVQLVGTILSLWDASALDQAGGDAEVIPTFINLTDAAIHMIPSMTLKDGKKLDNILSVSTAASNKYLFHFDSYHALTQWTAGIRLAMYEHTTLSEAYTGALIAGKGKRLNNIRMILDRQCAKYEDWVRVRFGAGTPWRRCWCVVSPPDEKEFAKLQKMQKKGSVYERPPVLKGDIKFYETKKVTKKTKAIATVKEAYACYAIYPQSKPLIDQSTLVKIEGKITVHSTPESTTEGFVFVMPETRPAISGFEIMLQYLFPVFDTFSLYGRPKKLIADVLDTRGLMFAMPSDRRYGYLEMWDVVGLINTEGSDKWSERQWRKQLKDLTSTRMIASGPDSDSIYSRASRRNTVSRAGFTPRGLRFEDQGSIRSSPSTRQSSPTRKFPDLEVQAPRRVGTAPATNPFSTPRHQRSVSEQANGRTQTTPSRFAPGQAVSEDEGAPTPPEHRIFNETPENGAVQPYDSSDYDESPLKEPQDLPSPPADLSAPPQGYVDLPPTQEHAAYQKPPIRPNMPTMKPNPAVDSATLQQMADAAQSPLKPGIANSSAAAAWRGQDTIQSRRSGEYGEQGHSIFLGVNSRPPPTNQNSGYRLSTIPASPYVEHSEFVDSPAGYQPSAPPVPEHSELPQQSQELPFRPHPENGNIPRKPVPGPSPLASQEDDNSSTTSSRLDSLRNDVIDPEALDALNTTRTTLVRQPSASSSRYDDDAVSTSTPDYASIIEEEPEPPPRRLPQRREDRPRSGVLTFIGDPNVKAPSDDEPRGYQSVLDPAKAPAEVPSIDFGPTYALEFNEKRPGTSGTMTQMLHDDASQSKENLATTPNEQNRLSYISGPTTPNTPLHVRSGSNSSQIQESRQVAWQPAMASPHQPDRQRLDPEEWVMHRASQQLPMMYGHGRSKSHTPPPFGRTHSGDWSQIQRSPQGSPGIGHSPGRPLSRGADLLLDQRPTTLSAREQEQVARMTNTPLLDLSQTPKKVQKQTTTGLTGYIDHREKEKAAQKVNRQSYSTAMQAEIDRRTFQTQQRQMMEVQQRQQMMMQQQMQQQYAMAQSNYAPSMMGTPNGMGAPSVMGAPSMMGTPSVMGMPTGPGTPSASAGMAYSTPNQMHPMYQQQQQYFPQQASTPQMQMSGTWGTPTGQMSQGQYFPQPSPQGYGNIGQQQQQQPAPTQAYGASFDQAQQAAKYAHQQHQSQFRR